MPCLLGFHTTFNAKNKEGDAYLLKAEVGECYERNECYLPTGNFIEDDALTYDLQNGYFVVCGKKISRHYRANGQGKMILKDPRHRFAIVYENDAKYAYRLIFNGAADTFICLEPQNCLVDAINAALPKSDRGFDVIGAGECRYYQSKIYILTEKEEEIEK